MLRIISNDFTKWVNVKLNSLYVEGRLNNFKEVYSVQKIFILSAKKQYFHWFDGIIIHY